MKITTRPRAVMPRIKSAAGTGGDGLFRIPAALCGAPKFSLLYPDSIKILLTFLRGKDRGKETLCKILPCADDTSLFSLMVYQVDVLKFAQSQRYVNVVFNIIQRVSAL